MPPAARASSGASLDGLVFALAGRRVSPTAQKAWTDFARAHGGEVILASHAKWEGPRVTHVVLVDRPASKQALAAAVAALPKACRARRGFPEPAVVDKDWFVQSAKRKRALPLEAFAFKAESASEDATRGAAERAEPDAHAGDVVLEDESSKQNVPSAPYGTSEACLAMELRIARRSLERWRDELKKRDGGDARRVTREAFRDFAAEGFPGLVGRTHAARRILEEETFPSTSEARQHEVDAEGRFVSEQVSDRKRRRVADEEMSEKTKSAGEKTTRTTLLDLPDELLAACVSSLPLLDTLAVAATCRRLANAALGPPLPLSEARVEKNGTTNWGRRRDAEARLGERAGWSGRSPPPPELRAVRVMTWNLKNNDPDPARRFAKQPGEGEAGGGWHWHVRVPVVARVIQREKPHFLCLQEDTRAMCRELLCAEEMTTARSARSSSSATGDADWSPTPTRYACFPSPASSRPGVGDGEAFGSSATLLEANDDFPFCDAPGAVATRVAREASIGARWERCSVWWDTDAFAFEDGGQFEWVDGRTLRARVNGETQRRWGTRMIPFTWVKLSAVDRECPSPSTDTPRSPRHTNRGLSVIVCSAHLEAGHDWMEDCPAKRDSARCVRAAVGLLQRRFGERVPIFVAGDFNAQKTQLHHRLLTGEGAGIVRGFERLDDAAKDAAKTRSTKKTRAARGASEKTPEKEKAVTTTKKGFFQSDSEDASCLTRRTQKRDGDGDEGSPPGDEGSFGETIVRPKESFDAERRRDLVDVFDALAEDNPNASFESTDKGVRSGGHRGTTWHDWRGPDWACMISSTMAKHGKHHSQLTYFDRAEVEVSEPAGLTTSGRKRARSDWRHQPAPGASSGLGGGFGGTVGGAGSFSNPHRRALGAVGHQRHIDHVYVARGDGVRDSSRDDAQVRVRVVRARVVVDCASADVKAPGESLCACGFASAAMRHGTAPFVVADADEDGAPLRVPHETFDSEIGEGREKPLKTCSCGERGVWASDHFPVVCDARVSWRAAERAPPSRRSRRDRAHSPDRR